MTKLALSFFLAVFISALCSIAEAVLYSISLGSIERIKAKYPRLGKILEELRLNIEEPITAILTLNTIANTAGAAIAGVAASEVFGEQSLAVFSLVFTLTILIFSEIIPKTVGVIFNDRVAPFLAYPLYALIFILKPFIFFCRKLVFFIEKTKKKQTSEHTEEEILAVLRLGRRSGIIKPYEEVSIQNILALDKKTVSEVMTPRTVMFCLPAKLKVRDVLKQKKFLPHSRIPVYEDEPEDIIGIVLRRDILTALAEDKHEIRLLQLMKPVQFVPESITLDKVLVKFLETRNHLFVVLDEYGGVAGLITLEDVLEEIIGKKIVDETDEVEDLRKLARERKQKIIAKSKIKS